VCRITSRAKLRALCLLWSRLLLSFYVSCPLWQVVSKQRCSRRTHSRCRHCCSFPPSPAPSRVFSSLSTLFRSCLFPTMIHEWRQRFSWAPGKRSFALLTSVGICLTRSLIVNRYHLEVLPVWLRSAGRLLQLVPFTVPHHTCPTVVPFDISASQPFFLPFSPFLQLLCDTHVLHDGLVCLRHTLAAGTDVCSTYSPNTSLSC
jgi:hypothetical protein